MPLVVYLGSHPLLGLSSEVLLRTVLDGNGASGLTSPSEDLHSVCITDFRRIVTKLTGIHSAVIMFVLPSKPPIGFDNSTSVIKQTLRMDWIGAAINAAAVVLLVMGLQWGGNSKPWKDAGVIAVSSLLTFHAILSEPLTICTVPGH